MRINRFIPCLWFLLLFAQQHLSSQTNPFLSDFDYLVKKLEETHPDPYTGFGGTEGFIQKKNHFSELMKEDLTPEAFVMLLNQFLSSLNDGHTFANFPDNSAKSTQVLPMRFKIAADGIFVLNTTSEFAHLRGMTLSSVNGYPVDELLARTKSFLPAENLYGEHFNLLQILNNNTQAQRFFSTTDPLEFAFTFIDNKKVSQTIPYQDSVVFLPEQSALHFENSNGMLYWSLMGENNDIAHLAWNSILSREVLESAYRSNPQWIEGHINWAYSFLNFPKTGDLEQDIQSVPSLYEEFYLLSKAASEAHARYLIIDLRYNGGGMTPIVRPLLYPLYGDAFLDFDFNGDYSRRISPLWLQKIGFSNLDDFNTANATQYTMGDFMSHPFGNMPENLSLEEKRVLILQAYEGFGKEYLAKTPPLTDVEIIILTSPHTFSAAIHFTWFMERLGRTTLVGVPSRQAGNAFMESTFFNLPATHISVSISNARQILYCPEDDRGQIIRPHYEMYLDDYARLGFDANAEILRALEVINMKKTVRSK